MKMNSYATDQDAFQIPSVAMVILIFSSTNRINILK